MAYWAERHVLNKEYKLGSDVLDDLSFEDISQISARLFAKVPSTDPWYRKGKAAKELAKVAWRTGKWSTLIDEVKKRSASKSKASNQIRNRT